MYSCQIYMAEETYCTYERLRHLILRHPQVCTVVKSTWQNRPINAGHLSLQQRPNNTGLQ